MAASLAQRGATLFSKLPKPSLFGLLAAILALAIVIQGVRLFWTMVTPVAPVGDWRPKVPQPMDAAAQSALFASFDPFFRQQAAAEGNEKVTSLSLTLFGIRSNEASGAGSAIIADSEGVQYSYLTGEEIMPGVTLHAVAFDHVVLSNNGSLEKLFLDQSVPAETVGGEEQDATPQPTPEPNAVAGGDVQLNPQSLASSIQLAPRNEGGAVTGLVVSAKDDGAMMRAAGLRAGDIITKVNGQAISSAADMISQLRPGARLSVEVERGAQTIPVSIILENP